MTAQRLAGEMGSIFDGEDGVPATRTVARCHWCGGPVGTRDGMVVSLDEVWVPAHRGPCPPAGMGASPGPLSSTKQEPHIGEEIRP
jgi:hypothetical protein